MRLKSNFTSKPYQNPSFQAVGYDAISALNTEVTGQKQIYISDEMYVEQLPDLKYRLFSNYEKGVIIAINEKARANEKLNIGVFKSVSGNKNYVNEYGDTFTILDNKGRIIKKVPNAIGKGLSPIQQINNLKFTVDLAEKIAAQDGQSLIKKLFKKSLPKPENLRFNHGIDNPLYQDTVFTTDSKIINSPVEELHYPISEELDVNGLKLKESTLKQQSEYGNFVKQGKSKTFHNVIQRNIGNVDEQQKLADFLHKISPEMESSNTFTVEMYNKLSQEQKTQLRDFCSNDYSFLYGDKKTSTKIDTDMSYIDYYSQVAKNNLDKKYGKGNYKIFGLGNSPSCMLSMLNIKDGINATTIPFSRTAIDEINPQVLKDTNEKIDWKKYFEEFGITPLTAQENKKQGKATVIVDYVESNKTMELLEDIFKKIGIPVEDFKFEDLGDLCKSAAPEDAQLNRIFEGQFFNGRKIKLYSTSQNIGNNIDFYKNIKDCMTSYKWHPCTKLYFFSYFDKLAKQL